MHEVVKKLDPMEASNEQSQRVGKGEECGEDLQTHEDDQTFGFHNEVSKRGSDVR